MHNFNKDKKFDLIVLFILLFAATLVSFLFELKFLISTHLFFTVPALYLVFRQKKNLKKILLASIIIGLFWAFSLDFIAEYNKVWDWAPDGGLLFPDKISGLVPIDILFWFFWWVFEIIVFYEHFIDTERSKKISPRWRHAVILGVIFLSVIIIVYNTAPEKFRLEYPYIFIGLITTVFGFLILCRRPHLIPKTFLTATYFTFAYFIFELTALHLDQWRFPAKYIAEISVTGVQIPIEELVVWILLSSSIVAVYYEFFIDDGK